MEHPEFVNAESNLVLSRATRAAAAHARAHLRIAILRSRHAAKGPTGNDAHAPSNSANGDRLPSADSHPRG